MPMRARMRRRGYARLSRKLQANFPKEAVEAAGLRPGDELRAEAVFESLVGTTKRRHRASGDPSPPPQVVTLCVQAGIAAADAICCRALGEHAQGEDHAQAIDLLRRVGSDGPELASSLAVLLEMETRASYDAIPVSGEQRTRARRRAKQLVDAARLRVGA